MQEIYTLPELPYGYADLTPHISEEQLRLHHDIHHAGYVKTANAILTKLDEARQNNAEIDMKSTLKELSFNVAGHSLHSMFWQVMTPQGGGEPKGELAEAIKSDFGSFERFKIEFTKAAATVEGSGWAGLAYDQKVNKLLLVQIEKHNVNVFPMLRMLMCVDVWEHAYYLDYKNERGKFIEAFWQVVNWENIDGRLRRYKS